jgi:cell division protein FtsI (penicillin-binding protein 3)
MEGNVKKNFTRLIVFVLCLVVFSGLIVARYTQLALESGNLAVAEDSGKGDRGMILDRNGRILAMDTPKYDVSIWRPSTDPDVFRKEISQLASILGVPGASLLSRYDTGIQDYFYVAKRLSSDQVKPLVEAISEGRFKGVQVDEVSGRIYPEGNLASHLVGFTGEGNVGLDGIEIKYDEQLKPKQRKSEDGTGRLLDSTRKTPRGDTITLTIDANLQYLLEEIIGKARKDNGAESAFAIAMDVLSGEILAYVSVPTFDLNSYASYSREVRRDLLSLYSYEPGSVFKIFSMASVLDMGAITPQTVFDCDGAYRKTLSNGEKIVIKDLGVYGKQNLAGILALSSNAGVGYAADRVSDIDLYTRLKSFGFGMKTGVGLSGESSGSLREPDTWSARSKPTISIGQEVMVTPLQMVAAAAAVANGGVLLKPTTVLRIESADGDLVFEQKPQAIRRVISEESSRAIIKAMESASSMEGTGWRAKVSDIRMAVKTGTAQMVDPKTRMYSDKDFIASTLGIFPADSPRVALYVVLVKPRGVSYLGGQIAAPVLRAATEATISCIDLERGKTLAVVHEGAVTIPPAREVGIGEVMPDLTGFSKKELLPLLVRKDLRVVIEGNGYVVSQKPLVGTKLAEGAAITLRLE